MNETLEYNNGILLVIGAYQELSGLKKKSDLLKFISIHEDRRGIDVHPNTIEEFLERYGYNIMEDGRRISLPFASICLKYYNALRDEAVKIKKRPSIKTLINKNEHSIFGGLRIEIDEHRKMNHPEYHP